jgi:hypothetical protein
MPEDFDAAEQTTGVLIVEGRDLRLVCDPSCAAAVRNGTVREGDAEGVRRRFYLPITDLEVVSPDHVVTFAGGVLQPLTICNGDPTGSCPTAVREIPW